MSDRSLWRHADFLRLWAAQSISAIGSRITRTALPIIAVKTLGQPDAVMGVLGAMQLLPGVVLAMVAGGWVDRSAKRRILIGADLVRAILVASLTLAWALGALSMTHVVLVGATVGAATALFQITDVAYLPSLIGKRRLADGNAKLQTTEAIAEIAGPASAGALIAALGAPLAVVLDAASYLWSALMLGRIRSRERRRATRVPAPHAARAPAPDATRVPAPDAARAPAPDAARLSGDAARLSGDAARVPGDAARAPAPDAARVPAPDAARVSAPDAARLPAPDAARLPAPDAARLPAPDAARVSAPDAARVSAPDATRVPAPDAARAPAPDAARLSAPDAARVPAPDAARVSGYAARVSGDAARVGEDTGVVERVEHEGGGFRVGMRAIFGHPLVRPIVLALMTWSITGGFFTALYTPFCLREIGLSERTFGAVVAMGGVGALGGALLSRWLVKRLGVGRTLVATSTLSLAFGVFIPLADSVAAHHSHALTLVFLVAHQLMGDAFSVAFVVVAVTLRQTVLPKELLGRANAAIHVCTIGILPIASLAAGALAAVAGIHFAMWFGVLIGMGAPVFLWSLRRLRDMPAPELSASDSALAQQR